MSAERTGFSVAEPLLCAHCGHVRGLHGYDHGGCMSSFADGKPGNPCRCSGFARPATPERGGDRG